MGLSDHIKGGILEAWNNIACGCQWNRNCQGGIFHIIFFQNEKELVRLHGLQYTYVIAKCFINFQHQIRSNFCIWIIVRHLIHLCLNRNSVLPTQGIKSVHLHRKQKLQQTLTINRDLTQKLTALDPPNMSAGKHEPDPENVMPLRERM